MLVQVHEINVYYSYDIVRYSDAYATIAVNTHDPFHNKYINYSEEKEATKIVACNGENEITLDHDDNVLLIKTHRRYKVAVQYTEDIYDDSDVNKVIMHNMTQAALWVATNAGFFQLRNFSVEVDSNKFLIVISLNPASARVVIDAEIPDM